MAKISVLVPIYNVENYLRECLDSLINQTLRDIEIICINDGSTDSSTQILEEYAQKDNRIKVINKSNSGYGNSMNIGLEQAAGEYVGIVEPDDFVKTTMFEDLYGLAKKNDADIVKSEYYAYTTQNNQARKTGRFARFRTNKVINVFNTPGLVRMQPSIWTAIYKREFLKASDIRFLETPGASFQDTSFAFKVLAKAQRIVLSPNAYYYYRQDNASSSVKSKAKIFLVCGEFDEITDFLNKNPEIKNAVNSQKLIKQYSAYMWNLSRIDEGFRDKFIDVFSDTFKLYYENNEMDREFYRKINKKEFLSLINDKNAFKNNISKRIEKSRKRELRRQLFSVRINASRISIVILGKQIIGIG